MRNQCAHWLRMGLSGTAVLAAIGGSVSKENCLSHWEAELRTPLVKRINGLATPKYAFAISICAVVQFIGRIFQELLAALFNLSLTRGTV